MSKENLYSKEAIEKVRDLAKSIDFAMMITNLKKTPLHAIPMSTKKVDKEGNVWFLSSSESTHNSNIRSSSDIYLIYSDKSSMEFLNIYGKAQILKDKSVLEDLYEKTDDAWFDGVEDPKLTAIKVVPRDVFYWDTKHNKLVSLFKMGLGALTGDEPDLGKQGELKY
ncbi:pyridoxamine 5'-phosphate oxidase family protein [Galbibacter sp. BG1]|uniref:pyridoxamine 5'-phosphate oxidase family protein n=1 Tax=Galbibacter sp. BG1 TaxID=1170699 RepID=UPI0015B94131|nr:pyridoxamine 5'-phosphate oxidase family protein [Galbibacter sp. BG1]QLE02548.1 pyridoxamine 5'-phosphate oxidase family protein [Galbibacter sp. BG1]